MYHANMGVMVQIRNLDPQLHEQLRARADAAQRSMSDYLKDLIVRDLLRPVGALSVNEAAAELHRADPGLRERIRGIDWAAEIRSAREAHESEMDARLAEWTEPSEHGDRH